MIIKKKEEMRSYTIYEIKKYCCKGMENLFDFCIVRIENGEVIIYGYSFRKAIRFCPFCGSQVQQEL